MGLIYCATCKANGKVYIGQTKHSTWQKCYRTRWGAAKFASQNRILSRREKAMLKHGKTGFEFRVLVADVAGEAMDELEKMYISKFRSTEPNIGYNTERGGSLSREVSEATRKRLSDAWKCKVRWFHREHGEITSSISAVARQYVLDYSSLHHVRNGEARSHRGWICLDAPQFFSRSSAYVWSHPDFGIVIGDSVHIGRIDPLVGKNSRLLGRVRTGHFDQYKRWKFIRNTTLEEDLAFRLWWAKQDYSDSNSRRPDLRNPVCNKSTDT